MIGDDFKEAKLYTLQSIIFYFIHNKILLTKIAWEVCEK